MNSHRDCNSQRGQLIYNPDAHARYEEHAPRAISHSPVRASTHDARNRILNTQRRVLENNQDCGSIKEDVEDCGVLELTAVKLLDVEGSCQSSTRPAVNQTEPHYVTPKHANCLSGTLVQIA